jgi:hypothetical protein
MQAPSGAIQAGLPSMLARSASMKVSLAPMQANELAHRLRAYQIFS